MRFSAVAGVAATPKHVAAANALAQPYLNAAALEVAHRDHRTVTRFDHDVVASQPHPSRGGPTALGQGVADRGQSSERGVIWRVVVHGDDHTVSWRPDGAAEAGEKLGWLGRRREPSVIGAVRPPWSTGTKSIANDVANTSVPWLGTRSAGLFWVSQRPSNG